MVSSAILKTTRTSEFFKDHQNSTSPKDKCYLRSFENLRVREFSNCTRNHAITCNIHDKIMQNRVIRLRHVQNN